MPASAILVLSTDPATTESITSALSAVGYAVTTETDPEAAFGAVPHHQLVVLDVVEGERSPADICREIRNTPSMASIPVLCVAQTDTVEERISFLEAGADDVMARPFDQRELEARVEALLVRFQRSRELGTITAGGPAPGGSKRRSRTIAVFSPKGGSGATTIATNIAVVRARQRPDRVVLIDLDLQFGSAATHLNLDVRSSLAEIVQDESALRDAELLRTYTLRHDTGLQVIAAPPSPELAELIEPRHVSPLLETAIAAYESVIVDAGSVLSERTMVVLDAADGIVIPVQPEMAALKAVHSFLDYLNEIGSASEKTTFVLNNMWAREILRIRDVESALGTKVGAELPYDPFLYLKAVNEGVPLVVGAPRSVASDRLVRLTETAFGSRRAAVPGGAPAAAQAKPRRLTGILRRN